MLKLRALIALFLCGVMLFSCFSCASEDESAESSNLSSSESASAGDDGIGDPMEKTSEEKGETVESCATGEARPDEGTDGALSMTTETAESHNLESKDTFTDSESEESEDTFTDRESEESDEMNSESVTEGLVENVTEEPTDEIFVAESEVETFTPSVTFLEGYEDAAIITADGLEFFAYGYDSISNEKFVISENFFIEINKNALEEFNRVTLCYFSSAALRCTVEYLQDGESKQDSFFLEEGSNIFSGLIEDYLDGRYAEEIVKIGFDVIEGERAELMIYNVVCSERRVYNDDT